MSRWLWALLGGVVLVAIAAVFWIASNQTNVTPPVSSGPTPVAPAARLPPLLRRTPRPRLRPHAPAAQEAAAPPAGPAAPPAPTPAPDAGQQADLAACPRAVPRDALGSARRRAGAFTSACSRPARRNAPAAARARTGGAGSPGRICAQEPRAAGRDLGLFRGGLRPAFPAARRRLGLSAAGGQVRPGRDRRVPKRILLPSAICQIEGASEAEGALKVSAECEDSISYHASQRDDRAPLRHRTHLQRFRRSGARDNPEEMRAVRGRQ